MICKNCGKEIDDNAKFCTYCGEEVKTESVEKEVDKGAIKENINKISNKWKKLTLRKKIIVGIIGVLVLIGVVDWYTGRNSSKIKAVLNKLEASTTESTDYDENGEMYYKFEYGDWTINCTKKGMNVEIYDSDINTYFSEKLAPGYVIYSDMNSTFSFDINDQNEIYLPINMEIQYENGEDHYLNGIKYNLELFEGTCVIDDEESILGEDVVNDMENDLGISLYVDVSMFEENLKEMGLSLEDLQGIYR